MDFIVEDLVTFGGDSIEKLIETFSAASNCDEIIVWRGNEVKPDQIKRLILSNLKLNSIDAIAPIFRNVLYLNLSFNNIVDISSISHMRTVEVLDISHNKLSGNLPELCHLVNLKVFRGHCNAISSLEFFSNLIQLREVWISNNNIDWMELVYLSFLSSLQRIIISENPFVKKSKYLDFIVALCPTIEIIDGSPVRDILIGTGVDLYKQSSLSSLSQDFLKTTDGRVMLAQARSHMSNPSTLRHKKGPITVSNLSPTLDEETSILSPLQYKQQLLLQQQQQKQQQQHIKRHTSLPLLAAVSRGSNPLVNDEDQDDSLQAVNHTVGTNNNSRTNNSKSINLSHSKHLSVDSLNNNVSVFKANKKGKNNSKDSNSTSGCTASSPPLGMTATSGFDSTENDFDSEEATVSAAAAMLPPCRVEATVLRFGSKSDSPVALCLYTDGSGYVRWSRGGPIAISLEGGRLMATYSSGGVAVTIDCNNGSGSIMGLKGNCILSLSSTGVTATIMNANSNKSNEVVATYTKGEFTSESSTTRPSHRWSLQGLEVEFLPATWEVTVAMSNSRLQCSFSSVSGGVVLKELETDQEGLNSGGGGGGNQKRNNNKATVEKKPLVINKKTNITTTETVVAVLGTLQDSPIIDTTTSTSVTTVAPAGLDHQSLRSELQSMMTNLDVMLADIGVTSSASGSGSSNVTSKKSYKK